MGGVFIRDGKGEATNEMFIDGYISVDNRQQTGLRIGLELALGL